MDIAFRNKFTKLWNRYFNESELPVAFYYSGTPANVEHVTPPPGHQCVIGPLARVRRGKSLCFDADAIGCKGGKRYLGFSQEIMPHFNHFLSCGIPDKLEGERYKKTPEIVREMMADMPEFKAPSTHIIFKRWDMLDEHDAPEVVIFFARPDVLSGLFTLSGFDEADRHTVISPFGAGCATIVQYPFLEQKSEHPKAVLGMFDVSARPFVPADTLTFSIPMAKFSRMVDNMEESFLITHSWAKVQKRISTGQTALKMDR